MSVTQHSKAGLCVHFTGKQLDASILSNAQDFVYCSDAPKPVKELLVRVC